MFTEEVLCRFRNPKNTGELKDYNGRGKSGDSECSDVIEMFVKFVDDKVVDAKFKVFGCPSAISITDVFIDIIKGLTIEEACNIDVFDLADALGGLPLEHMHCTKLPKNAFMKAVEEYRQNSREK